MIFLPLYAWIAPKLGFSIEYTNIVPRLWSSLVFWATILGLPFLLLTRDYAWKAYVSIPLFSSTSLMLSTSQVQECVYAGALSRRAGDPEVQPSRLPTPDGAVPEGTSSRSTPICRC